MAFVLHHSWDAAAERQTRSGRAAHAGLLAPLFAHGRDRAVRKAGATLLSVLVHILLLWLFLTRLAGNTGAEDGTGAGALLSFTLSGSAPAAAPASTEAVRPRRPSAPAASEVDASVATELPPTEWSLSRLPPAPGVGASEQSSASGAADGPSAGAGAGAGNAGADLYDPYAGAAPLRRESETRGMGNWLGERVLGLFGFAPAAAGGLVLDEEALEAIRRTVARSLPGRHGTVDLTVRLSPTGVVLDVDSAVGSAPSDAREAIARAMIGKRLFLGAANDAQTVALPTLRFG